MLSGIFLRRNLVDDHLVLWCVSDQVLSPSRATAVRYIVRHSPAMRTIACTLRSTSAPVVAHEDTLILMPVSPFRTVPPHPHLPPPSTPPIPSMPVATLLAYPPLGHLGASVAHEST